MMLNTNPLHHNQSQWLVSPDHHRRNSEMESPIPFHNNPFRSRPSSPKKKQTHTQHHDHCITKKIHAMILPKKIFHPIVTNKIPSHLFLILMSTQWLIITTPRVTTNSNPQISRPHFPISSGSVQHSRTPTARETLSHHAHTQLHFFTTQSLIIIWFTKSNCC